MTALKKISLSSLSHELLASLIRSILDLTASLDSDPFVKRHRLALNKALTELHSAFQRVLKCEFTKQLAVLDTQRDKIIVGLRAFLKGAIAGAMIDSTKASQAASILEYVNRMDEKVTSLGYLEESAQIMAFLQEVETVNGASEECGALVYISALDTVQKKFNTLFNSRESTVEASATIREIKIIRLELTERLNTLIPFIRSGGTDLPAQFGTVVTNLNKLFDDVSATAKFSETAADNAKAAKEAALTTK